MFRLKFPKRTWISGLWVGGHFAFHAQTEKGEAITRKYTPISFVYREGCVDFAIKIYQESPEFPSGGKMSKYLDSLEIGNKIMVEGPFGSLRYHGFGNFEKLDKPLPLKKKIGMICAGSGLTPHLNIAKAALMAKDGVEITMLYVNKTKDDIMCESQLYDLDINCDSHFSLFLTLTRHNE